MALFATNIGGSTRERLGISPRLLRPCAAVLLVLSATGCVSSPPELGTVKVGVDAEWHSMDAESDNVEAIKQQKQQELWARQQPPLPDTPQATAGPSLIAPPHQPPPSKPLTSLGPPPTGRDNAPGAPARLPAVTKFPERQVNYEQVRASRPQPAAFPPAAAKPDRVATPQRRPKLEPPAIARYMEPESRPVAAPTLHSVVTSTDESSLRFLGFVEDSQGQTAALLDSSPGGVRLVRVGDTVLLKDEGRDRELRVYEITSRDLHVRNDHEEKTIYFRD